MFYINGNYKGGFSPLYVCNTLSVFLLKLKTKTKLSFDTALFCLFGGEPP